MDSSRHDKKRINVEGDRLSNLPDDLIHKVISLMGIKQAIQTSALSSRWRNVWTSMPCLNFSSEDSVSSDLALVKFSEFVTRVLSGRNSQMEVSSVTLTFRGEFNQVTFESILNYAFAHNVQQLDITCLAGADSEFPFSLFRSESLKHLTLNGYYCKPSITIQPAWELPALTTLNLHSVTVYDDNTDNCACLFFNCANIQNLTLKGCRFRSLNGFTIHHPGLSSLRLQDGCKGVNVVTPQLKSLTITNCRRINLISTPNLSFLRYKDYYRSFVDRCWWDEDDDDDYDDFKNGPLRIFTEFPNLEKVHLCINRPFAHIEYPPTIVRLLQRLHCVKFLTLNLELVELLSSSVELILHQPSPFVNLKSLIIYPPDATKPELTLSTEVKNFLLDSSSGATLTMVSHEEIRVVMNVTTLRNLMRKLQELLDEWKENSETNTAKVVEKVEVENHIATKMKWQFGERATHIESYWKNLNEQFEEGYKYSRRTISLLRDIEGVLTKLPMSHRAKFQERFSGLCAEADAIMDSVTDHVKFQCDKKPSRSNIFFCELATSSSHSSP